MGYGWDMDGLNEIMGGLNEIMDGLWISQMRAIDKLNELMDE